MGTPTIEKETTILELHGQTQAKAVLRTSTGLKTLPLMPLQELLLKIRQEDAKPNGIVLQIAGAGPTGEDLILTELSALNAVSSPVRKA